jgi:DNA-binding NtrC family response regulator
MLEVFRLVDRYACARTPLILVGETGTGKTFIARMIHELSGRAGEPFVVLTAGELRGSLGHDVLFGHERGAYTGASGRRGGLLLHARHGTLLIDDFHRLGARSQIQLLRVLEEGRYRPHGADREMLVECRVLVALRHEPDRLVRDGVLLEDIRHRLGYAVIHLPCLAERPDDIPLLAHEFLARSPVVTGVPDGPTAFAPEVMPILVSAPWPGNLRELRKVVEAAYLLARGEPEVRVEHLPQHLRRVLQYQIGASPAAKRRAIERALVLARGRVSTAARLCGASRATVYRVVSRAAGNETGATPSSAAVRWARFPSNT